MRRFLAALWSLNQPQIHYYPDRARISETVLRELSIAASRLNVNSYGIPEDTQNAAALLKGVDLVVSLGGDGTHRALAKGWRNAPLVALSTGTNNAYAQSVEATTAGLAAAILLRGDAVCQQTKTLHVRISGSTTKELALMDVVGTKDRFIGARALVDPKQYLFAVVSEADATKMGTVGIAGACAPLAKNEPKGLALTFNADSTSTRKISAAIAPGLVRPVSVSDIRVLGLAEEFSYAGPFTLALDGERELHVQQDQVLRCSVHHDGPTLLDVQATVRKASQRGNFFREYRRVCTYA